MRLPIIPSLLLGLCPLAQATDVQWQFGLDASTSHQRFAGGSADLRSLMFTPVAQWDDWDFSLSVPWEASSGGYLVGRNLAARPLCTRLANLSEAQLQRRLARGKLKQAQIDACTAQALGSNGTGSSGTQTGFGDADVSGTYHWVLADDWMLDLGTGYKFDNGDWANGLGSGTQEARLEANLIYAWNALTASVTAGVNLITQSAPQAGMQDQYTYTSLALDYALLDALTLGCSYHYQQSAYTDAEAPSWLALSLSYQPIKNLSLRAAVSQFSKNEDYPEQELTAGIGYSF